VISWGQLFVDITAGATVGHLKQLIEQNIKIVPGDQKILFKGEEWSSDNRTLQSYGVGDGEHIYLICSGENSYFLIPTERFDSQGDFDYTGSNASPSKRGGDTYIPPAGWRRYGLKVSGLFENDVWLGMDNKPGEWIVSYHGTGVLNVKGISEEGYELSKGKRFAYGEGVYSAPLVSVAEDYAQVFNCQGKRFKMVFMNRVNPDPAKLKRQPTEHGLYFVSYSDKDIRPYGILIKEIS
jgi:hypothetical protein